MRAIASVQERESQTKEIEYKLKQTCPITVENGMDSSGSNDNILGFLFIIPGFGIGSYQRFSMSTSVEDTVEKVQQSSGWHKQAVRSSAMSK